MLEFGDDGVRRDLMALLLKYRDQLAGVGPTDHDEADLMRILRSHLHHLAGVTVGWGAQAVQDQSDLVQQTCLRVVENFSQFTGNTEAELHAWLKTILMNEWRQEHRRKRSLKRDTTREVALEGGPSRSAPIQPVNYRELTPRTNVLARERAELARAALARLPEHFQTIIRKRNWESMSFAAIADELGETVNCVEKRWGRAIRKLKDELKVLQGQSRDG